MRDIFLSLILLLQWTVSFGNNEDLFNKANELLLAKDFQSSLDLYRQIEKNGFSGPGIYQNMALASLSMQQDAMAIYYLEKALKYAPNNKQVKENLENIIKRNSKLESAFIHFGLKQYFQGFFGIFSLFTWIILSIASFLALGLMILLKYPIKISDPKFKYSLIVLVSIFIFSSVGGYIRNEMIYHNPGIIITNENALLRMGPDETSPEVTDLPAGSKVMYKDFLGEWWFVETIYGDKGWIPATYGLRI